MAKSSGGTFSERIGRYRQQMATASPQQRIKIKERSAALQSRRTAVMGYGAQASRIGNMLLSGNIPAGFTRAQLENMRRDALRRYQSGRRQLGL